MNETHAAHLSDELRRVKAENARLRLALRMIEGDTAQRQTENVETLRRCAAVWNDIAAKAVAK